MLDKPGIYKHDARASEFYDICGHTCLLCVLVFCAVFALYALGSLTFLGFLESFCESGSSSDTIGGKPFG